MTRLTNLRAIAERRLRTRFSASQVETFRSCPRKWFLGYVCGARSPSSPAQALGTAVHAEIEGFLRTGKFPGDDQKAARLAAAAQRTLPRPGPDLLVEGDFVLPLRAGPKGEAREMVGVVDLASPRSLGEGRLKIVDHKTTRSFNWMKTEAELRRNVQANVYAFWGYSLPRAPFLPVPPTEAWRPLWEEGVDEVDFAHNCVLTEGRGGSALVSTPMPFASVAREWAAVGETVDEMSELALSGPDDPLGVAGNARHCGEYNGCYFGCGPRGVGLCADVDVGEDSILRKVRGEREEREMDEKGQSIRERLAARRAAQLGAAAQAPGSAAPVEPAVGVVPPDAPPREQSAEDAATVEPTARQKKRAAQRGASKTVGAAASAAAPGPEAVAGKMAEVEKAAQEVRAALADLPSGRPAVAGAPGGLKLLFVDCLPIDAAAFRATFGADPTPIEKWLDPIKRATAEEYGEPDYQLVEFGKGKGALSAAIHACLGQMPAIAQVSSFSRSADLVIDAAVANGWLVFKATRG